MAKKSSGGGGNVFIWIIGLAIGFLAVGPIVNSTLDTLLGKIGVR